MNEWDNCYNCKHVEPIPAGYTCGGLLCECIGWVDYPPLRDCTCWESEEDDIEEDENTVHEQ